jgi:hypothetical protein
MVSRNDIMPWKEKCILFLTAGFRTQSICFSVCYIKVEGRTNLFGLNEWRLTTGAYSFHLNMSISSNDSYLSDVVWVNITPLCIEPHFLYPFIGFGYLDWFHSLAIVNSAAILTAVQVISPMLASGHSTLAS